MDSSNLISISQSGQWLPLLFAALMGLAIVIYVLLDGYDLGVGILMPLVSRVEQDVMIAAIGPYWDANETWLVLAVGILLVAFPQANGIILGNLYIPVAIMLLGLIFRGVAFDFRVKAKPHHQEFWNRAFTAGSVVTTLAQGYMLGAYISGFRGGWLEFFFALLVGICLVVGYCLIGSAWLILKTDGALQKKSIRWAQYSLLGTAFSIFLVSVMMLVFASIAGNSNMLEKWLGLPQVILLLPLPLVSILLIVGIYFLLNFMPLKNDRLAWLPYLLVAQLVLLSFHGMAYSFFPYIVPHQLTIVDAAVHPSSLWVMLFGVILVLPLLIAYTIYCYAVFWGKAKKLRYD